MPKCDFKKVAFSFIEIAFWHGCFPVHLLHISRKPFPMNTSGGLLMKNIFKANNIISVNAILMSIF